MTQRVCSRNAASWKKTEAMTLGEAAAAETKRRSTQERIEQTGHVLAGIKREAEAESELLNQQRSEAAAAAERRRSTASDLRRLETSVRSSTRGSSSINWN